MSEAILLAGAEFDYQAYHARLANSDSAKADRFDSEVQDAIGQLARFPRSAPPHVAEFRRLVLTTFPVAHYYVIEGQRVFIHALLDFRQSPAAIRRRLGIEP